MGQCADASQRPTSRRQHDLIPKMTRKYLSSHCVLCMRPNQHSRFRFQSPDVAAVCADFFDRLGCIFLCTELTVGRPCAWTRPVATLSECYSLTRHDGQTDGRTDIAICYYERDDTARRLFGHDPTVRGSAKQRLDCCINHDIADDGPCRRYRPPAD